MHGLLKTKPDVRDFDYFKTFGAVSMAQLPEEYQTGVPNIKNQGYTDMCTAFASCAVAEDEENNVVFSPEYFFAEEKAGSPDTYGADLRQAARTAVGSGFLPQEQAPFSLADKSADFLRNIQNWPNLSVQAGKYKRKSYFNVQKLSGYDLFDSIRMALYMNAPCKRSILTGSNWYTEWEMAEGGIIPEVYGSQPTLHAYKIFGWKQIGGQPYLMIQNSEGTDVGDKGVYYMSRDVANKELTEPLYMFVDIDDTVSPKSVGNSFVVFLINLFKFLWPTL